MQGMVAFGISHRFRRLSQSEGQIAHVLLTRSPLVYPRKGLTARLACVKHAASVRPEPGSNSPLKNPNPSKKQTPTKNCQNHCLLPKEPSNQPNSTKPSRKPDGYNNINSSTFDTLLSSQESHTPTTNPNRTSLRANLQKLTRVDQPSHFRGFSGHPGAIHLSSACRWPPFS